MPKVKTKRSAAKRFKVTKRGKIKRKKAKTRHILSSKSPGQKRRLGKKVLVKHADRKSIKQSMPYAF